MQANSAFGPLGRGGASRRSPAPRTIALPRSRLPPRSPAAVCRSRRTSFAAVACRGQRGPARFEIESIQPEADHGMVARIECADPAQCFPFMVALHVRTALLSRPRRRSRSRQSNSSALLVQPDASAMLLLDGAHVHISIPVICLENGALGQTIRATSPDRHQFYTVQVAGERVLRGRL